MRDLLQVVGWLEDGQHLIQQQQSQTTSSDSTSNLINFINWWQNNNQQLSGNSNNRVAGGNNINNAGAIILPDGQLYIPRVQLKDSNKSYRCQVKNVLNSKVILSALSGRLFVTGELLFCQYNLYLFDLHLLKIIHSF